MKTFDEALKKVVTASNNNLGLVKTNILQQGRESCSNPQFREIVIQLAEHLWKQIATHETAIEGMASTCAMLQALFEFGRLVGMEMEKQDDLTT